eukprot:PhM_4_TR6119/c0_g2_i2/m.59294
MDVEHYATLLGQVVAVNATFSFASDAVAQVLEGKQLPGMAPSSKKATTPLTEEAVVVDNVNPQVLQNDKTVEEPPTTPFDWQRSINFAASGVVFCGIVQFFRLEVINAVFPATLAPTLTLAVLKTGFNQLVFSPVVRAASMATIQYSKTKDVSDIWPKLKADFLEAQAVSYAVKPVSNVLAFWLFPHNLLGQTVAMRSVAFAYNVYYSFVSNRDVVPDSSSSASGSSMSASCSSLEIIEESDDDGDDVRSENSSKDPNTEPCSASDVEDSKEEVSAAAPKSHNNNNTNTSSRPHHHRMCPNFLISLC